MKEILNVRVDEELKNEIDRISKEEGITPSEYARSILYDYLGYDEKTKTFWVQEGEPIVINVSDISNIKKELPQLALLLFANLYSTGYYSEKNLEIAKGFLENLTKNDMLSNELRFEFLKVLTDINRVLAIGIQNTPVYFLSPDNMYTLDFDLLFDEVYDIINRDYSDAK